MAFKNVKSSDPRKAGMVESLKSATGATKVTMLHEDTASGAFFAHVLGPDTTRDSRGRTVRGFLSLGWFLIWPDGGYAQRLDSFEACKALLLAR